MGIRNAGLLIAIRGAGLTQEGFARAVGDDPSLVSRVVRGHFNLDPVRKQRWARVLKVPVNRLFDNGETNGLA